MSYANGTQHYNLPQTQGSDKRDWFDTNEAFRNVDTDLHTAKQTAETTASSLETTNENVTSVANRVTAVESGVQTLQGNLANTNENVATNSTAIASLKADVADNKQDLEDMITAYEEDSATASRKYEVGDYFRYNDVLYITTVVIAQGSTIVPDVNCESTNVMARVKLLESTAPTPTESIIDDSVTSSTKTWSSSKINTQLATKCNDSKVGNLSSLKTSTKVAIVNAINELYDMIGGGTMPELDFSNIAEIGTSYTTAKMGAVILSARNGSSASSTVSYAFNGNEVFAIRAGDTCNQTIHFVPSGTSITRNGGSFAGTGWFVPYK